MKKWQWSVYQGTIWEFYQYSTLFSHVTLEVSPKVDVSNHLPLISSCTFSWPKTLNLRQGISHHILITLSIYIICYLKMVYFFYKNDTSNKRILCAVYLSDNTKFFPVVLHDKGVCWCRNRNIPGQLDQIVWLLAPWLLASPDHQEPYYWICRIQAHVFFSRGEIATTSAISVLINDRNAYVSLLNRNSLWLSEAIRRHRSGSTLTQIMACCLTAPSHYLYQCWFITKCILWHPFGNFTRSAHEFDP